MRRFLVAYALFTLAFATQHARAEGPQPDRAERDAVNDNHTEAPWLWWFDVMPVGLGAIGEGGFIAQSLSAELYKAPHVVGLRLAHATEFCLFCPTPALGGTEVAALYGLGWGNRYVHVAASLGPAYVQSRRRGHLTQPAGDGWFSVDHYQRIDERTVGLAAQSSLAVGGENIAFVAAFAGNANSAQSFGGVFLGLRAGRLRASP